MKFSRTGLLTSVLVVAALFVGSYISSVLPSPDRMMSERPFLHSADIGETVSLRTADVTVTEVSTAKEVALLGQIAGTSGVWIVADITWSPVNAPAVLRGNSVVVEAADGRRFGGTQAIINNCGPTQPGLPVTCQLAVEMVADALDGAKLLIPASDSVDQSDDVAVVDLGIDADRAAELSQPADRVALTETTAVTR